MILEKKLIINADKIKVLSFSEKRKIVHYSYYLVGKCIAGILMFRDLGVSLIVQFRLVVMSLIWSVLYFER